MNKKKILVLAMALSMVAILALGGTIAYFTDIDSAENIMTLGGVDIMQNEEQLDENGELEAFEDNKPMMPMVDNRPEGDAVVVDGYFNPAMENVVDKIVTVTNEAEEGSINKDAYVRTIIGFETNNEYVEGTDEVRRDCEEIFNTYIGVLGQGLTYTDIVVEIDGTKYIIAYKVYENALVPGETSEPSLKQLFMSPEAGNEISVLFGDTYEVLALSQGVQTAGFDSAEVALNTAFGEITAENCAAWLADVE